MADGRAQREEARSGVEPSSRRPVRILYVATAFPRWEGDVITPWMTETLLRLKERGLSVEVLAPSYRGMGDHEYRGIPVHRFRYAPAGWETLTHDQTAPDKLATQPAFLGVVPGYVLAGMWAAARIARTRNIDVVHVHWPVPHVLMGLAARWAGGARLVCTFHGAELRWVDSAWPILRGFLAYAARTADAVTVNSSHTEAQVHRVCRREVLRLPFGATVSPRAGVSPATGASDFPEVLYVGRLVERKGVKFLLRAVAGLRDEMPLRLWIVGDGPERAALEAESEALGLADTVRFAGFVDTDELQRRYQSCRVFVLPAVHDARGDTEGLGVVLIEALAFGKPVVASAVGGIVDVVQDGVTGYLVPPGEPDRLRAALRRVIADPVEAKRLGEGGSAILRERFSWDAIIDRLVQLYGSLAS